MSVSTALKIIALVAQFVGWLEHIKAMKAAEADLFRRILAAARSEADAITAEFNSVARTADSSLQPDPFERP